MGQTQNDLNEDIYIGLELPLNHGQEGFFTQTKMLKPDPRSYISCLNDLNLQPQDCLFIDDQLRNIIGAQKIGLNTIHFNVLNPKESFSQALELSKF